jgi:hypothetical protein
VVKVQTTLVASPGFEPTAEHFFVG